MRFCLSVCIQELRLREATELIEAWQHQLLSGQPMSGPPSEHCEVFLVERQRWYIFVCCSHVRVRLSWARVWTRMRVFLNQHLSGCPADDASSHLISLSLKAQGGHCLRVIRQGSVCCFCDNSFAAPRWPTLCSPCDPVVHVLFSCDLVVTVLHPIFVFLRVSAMRNWKSFPVVLWPNGGNHSGKQQEKMCYEVAAEDVGMVKKWCDQMGVMQRRQTTWRLSHQETSCSGWWRWWDGRTCDQIRWLRTYCFWVEDIRKWIWWDRPNCKTGRNSRCRSVKADDALVSDGPKLWKTDARGIRSGKNRRRTVLRLKVAEDKKTTKRWKRQWPPR